MLSIFGQGWLITDKWFFFSLSLLWFHFLDCRTSLYLFWEFPFKDIKQQNTKKFATKLNLVCHMTDSHWSVFRVGNFSRSQKIWNGSKAKLCPLHKSFGEKCHLHFAKNATSARNLYIYHGCSLSPCHPSTFMDSSTPLYVCPAASWELASAEQILRTRSLIPIHMPEPIGLNNFL
jgi:hypothetical protein